LLLDLGNSIERRRKLAGNLYARCIFNMSLAAGLALKRLKYGYGFAGIVGEHPYAVTVIHDENLTGKMEFDASGIPLKGCGFSNNPDTSRTSFRCERRRISAPR
jgi:hypothetical protein